MILLIFIALLIIIFCLQKSSDLLKINDTNVNYSTINPRIINFPTAFKKVRFSGRVTSRDALAICGNWTCSNPAVTKYVSYGIGSDLYGCTFPKINDQYITSLQNTNFLLDLTFDNFRHEFKYFTD